MNTTFTNVDEYIAGFSESTQVLLEEVRQTIKNAAPDAEETIAYGMPAYKLAGALVYFAAFKHHIGFYPTSTGVAAFLEELANYKTSKGAIQFPINQPIPVDLIAKIVVFKVQENLAKAASKKSKKPSV